MSAPKSPRSAWVALLVALDACKEALAWARALPATTSPETAYLACERGDWILWLFGELHKRGAVTRQTLVLAVCAAARTALVHLKGRPAEAAALASIETTERWCRGEATLDEVRAEIADAVRAVVPWPVVDAALAQVTL